MPFDTLLSVAGRLAVLHLQVQIKMQAAGAFDENAGALFHGSLGWAMHDVAPDLWQLGYGELEQQDSRPFSILPPKAPCQWQAGDLLCFEFVGLAQMSQQLPELVQSFIRMGERGLGHHRLGFTVQRVVQHTPHGQCLLWQHHLPVLAMNYQSGLLHSALLQSVALSEQIPSDSMAVRVECLSRLRLKEQGKVLQSAPSAVQLAKAVCRRLLSVEHSTAAEKDQLYQLIANLAPIQIYQDNTRRNDLRRYSQHQQQKHAIEGISGDWVYSGPQVKQLLPWLALARWLHVGGKTSFGFGAIEWQVVVLDSCKVE
jgi:hypothetical protein